MMNIDRFELHTSHVGHDLTMRSIELFATKVAAIVRDRSRSLRARAAVFLSPEWTEKRCPLRRSSRRHRP